MCLMCPDAVEMCRECSLPFEGPGPHYGFHKVFYLEDKTWCSHLTEEFGTDSPSHYYHYQYEHREGCPCVIEDWWKGRAEPIYDKEE